ncbi:OmpA family protein [Mangrovivirga cuniculi]|uniref:OmpA-like domain-containing protein n=1 Tax=Mangrovivirga cuniculi TaxID=2715131 RepID=A0A4D7JA06_9BACT|nr:OmpA family protein [Mangrovivirga cuniculi]QCK13309.1 hypothetical protein DCC35_00365 [Mangrovivirga cuniculi]
MARTVFFFLLCFLCVAQSIFAQETQQINLERGLIAHFPLNEGPDDVTGNEITGTVNGAKLEESCRCGSNAYFFDGIDDYIEYDDKYQVLNGSRSGMTISFWFRPTRLYSEDFGLILGKWAFDKHRDQFAAFFNIENLISFTVADGVNYETGVYGRTRYGIEDWRHVILVWNKSGKMGVFVDGEMDRIDRQHGDGYNGVSDVTFKLGRQIVGQDRPYEGYIDEIKIWRRSLSFAEIDALWAEEKSFCNKMMIVGKTIDENTLTPISAEVTFEDLKTGRSIGSMITEEGLGDYEKQVDIGGKYAFYAKAKGYLPASFNIDTKEYRPNEEIVQDIYLVPIQVGSILRLNNIFFDYDKATLRDESRFELDRLIEIFEENPGMRVELGGHTDGDGSDAYNKKLSDRRANSVRTYLIGKGISEDRIEAVGYGESKPVADNFTEEGKQENRRVEFKIIDL